MTNTIKIRSNIINTRLNIAANGASNYAATTMRLPRLQGDSVPPRLYNA